MEVAPQPADGPSTFGALLRGYRVAAGLTQEALASRTGLSARGIGDLESGRRTWPQKETIRLLVSGLGLTGADRTAFVRAAQRPSAPKRHPAAATSAMRATARPERQLPLGAALCRPRARNWRSWPVSLAIPGRASSRSPAWVARARPGWPLEVAKQLAADFADGIVFVDLAPVSDPALLLTAIASALDLHEPGSQSIDRALIARLHDRRVLLILDNCEQLLPVRPETRNDPCRLSRADYPGHKPRTAQSARRAGGPRAALAAS